MARSLWKGAISFGLVHIPVDLHTAVQGHDLDLTMLDKRDFSPIGFKRYNKTTGAEVTWDNIVKGYEYSDGEYVVLTEEDLRLANPAATQTIDIQAFVAADTVPLTFYETPYYLSPGRGGDKVYALLRETLHEAGKVAIATVVIRTRQHLCALVAVGDGIILNTLRYLEEIRSPDDLKLPGASHVTDRELKMALSLVEDMSEDWQPEKYHDTYREDVLKLVERKVASGQLHAITSPSGEAPAPKATNVVDLVALLKQSLGGKGKRATQTETADADEEQEAAAPRARRAPAGGAAKARSSTAKRSEPAPASKARRSTAAKSTSTRRKAA